MNRNIVHMKHREARTSSISLEDTDYYKKIKAYDGKIMVFGAKEMAKRARDYIRTIESDVMCYVVSDIRGLKRNIDGIPVREIRELKKDYFENGLIVISHAYSRVKEIHAILEDAGFKNIIVTADCFNNSPSLMELESESKKIGLPIRVIDENMKEPKIENGKSICVYCSTSHWNRHYVREPNKKSSYIVPIQGGAAYTAENICEVKDNTGDNISILNPDYGDMTVGYWIAKNDTKHDYVGVCHYSRYFDLSDEQFNYIVNHDIDAVMLKPFLFPYEMVTIVGSDQEFRYVIGEVSPEYLNTYETFASNRLFSPANMVIAKRHIYNEWIDWYMKIIEKWKDYYKKQGKVLSSRQWAYVAEGLLNVYFWHHAEEQSLMFALQDETIIGDK